ncbi:MAG: hypothetical protein IT569_07505, partial [Leptospiraceae bacterium]|nr:hypothetical protein [Leptospiraceae bacterium]
MTSFLRSGKIKKAVICIIAAFVFDSLAFGFEFDRESQNANFVISNDTIKIFSEIFDKDSEEENLFFYNSFRIVLNF